MGTVPVVLSSFDGVQQNAAHVDVGLLQGVAGATDRATSGRSTSHNQYRFVSAGCGHQRIADQRRGRCVDHNVVILFAPLPDQWCDRIAPMANDRKIACALVRVSSEEQARGGYGLEFQEQDIRAYCARNNFELIRIFRDEGYSGATADRVSHRT